MALDQPSFLGRHARSVVAALGQTLVVSATDAPAAGLAEAARALGW